MRAYICISDQRKRHCNSATIEDTAEHIRELICFFNYYSLSCRVYETRYGLKIFTDVPYIDIIEKVLKKKEGERYAQVSDFILGEL